MNGDYIFLDGKVEREQLLRTIHRTREEVVQIIRSIPEDEWYTPRYHGWTPAAMVAHLNTVDTLSLYLIKLALLGFTPTMSTATLNRLNDFMARVFARRVMATSLESVEKNETRIADFITHLPMDKFSKRVFNPGDQKYLTIEQAIQAFFLHHWQTHLHTMREVEGIQPPTTTDNS